jgi:predicted ATPase
MRLEFMAAKKFVVTGGPVAGSDQVFARLYSLGYYLIRDVAKYAINGAEVEPDIMLDKDRDAIHLNMVKTQVQWEKEIPGDVRIAFLSSGALDSLAYYKLNGLNPPQSLADAAGKNGYDKIFVLAPMANDSGLSGITKSLYDVYSSHGHEPIIVGAPSFDARLDHILGVADPDGKILAAKKLYLMDQFLINTK